MKLVAFAAMVFAVGGPPAGWRTFHGDGVSFRYPPSWIATSAPLTAVTSPKQVIALASYRFRADVALGDGCEPKEAVELLPAAGAFVYGWEYGQVSAATGIQPDEFSPRPAHFTLWKQNHYECLGRRPGFMLRFSDHGLAFQVEVVLGSHASAATRTQVLQALDSFDAD